MFNIEEIPSRFKPHFEILALGSDTRAKISWAKNGRIFSLWPKEETSDLYGFYLTAAGFLFKKKKLRPRVIAFDPHPFFISQEVGGLIREKYFPKALLYPVFHHRAHVANFGIETGLNKKFIGVAFDGTGFGEDRCVWGGEFFIYDRTRFKRAAHLEYQLLPGNEKAILEPWRSAFALLRKIYGRKVFGLKLDFLKEISKDKLKLVEEMIDRNFNSPQTSSVGRLFDAVSAMLNLKTIVAKEAQAAQALENTARQFKGKAGTYSFKVREKDGILSIDFLPALKEIAEDLVRKENKARIAYSFHLTVAFAVYRVCSILKRKDSINHVYFSGGVFMNDILTEELKRIFKGHGFSSIFSQRPCTTDIGISQGQIAACCMERFRL